MHVCFCVTTVKLFLFPFLNVLPAAKRQPHNSATPLLLPRTRQRCDELSSDKWSAIGGMRRQKGWGTKNSLAVVMCATPIQDGLYRF